MADVTGRAFEIDSLILEEKVAILAGTEDPTMGAGEIAPVGSLYLRTDGSIYNKTDSGDTDWQNNISSSYYGNILTSIDYAASDKVLIFVNTTTQSVIVTLPSAASYTNRIFNIKWILTSSINRCSVEAQIGETIDGENCHIFGEVYDSLQIVSDGTQWWII